MSSKARIDFANVDCVRLVNAINHCSFLAKRGVKEDIQNFDARKISPDIRKNVEAFLKKNAGSFEPKVSAHFLGYIRANTMNYKFET